MFRKTLLILFALLLCCAPLSGCADHTPTPPDQPDKPSDPNQPDNPDTPDNPSTPAAPEAYDYVYPDGEYEKRLDLFGERSEYFAPGKRTLVRQIHTGYDSASGQYTVTRDAFTVSGVRTYASVDRAYSPAMHVNVDAYCTAAEYAAEFRKAGYDRIGFFTSSNKSGYAASHPEILQCDGNGSRSGFWDSVVLTDKVLNYNFGQYLRPANRKNVWQIGIIEPEMFRAGAYSEAFQELWELKYGEAFEDPYHDVSAMFRSQRLSVWTVTNAIKYYVSQLAAKNETFRRFAIAPHSTLAYAALGDGVTDGYVHMMGTGLVRSVTGQTWSNPMENPIRYAGADIKDPFINGLIDYGTYLDAADYYGADFFALCDPMSDTAATTGTEEYWRSLCHMQLVASLMYPEINRWELIWTNRSFMNVSPAYRTEQLNIHNALLEISGQAYRSTGGTAGITYLLSDTLTWQTDARPGWGGSAYDGFWGIVSPLAYDGILPRTRAMELITSADDLEGVRVLIVSYDNQKPLYPEVNSAIAEWVKAGGTLLCVGGPDEYLETEGAWWHQSEGESPVGDLLLQLGLKVTARPYTGGNSSVTWQSKEATGDLSGLRVKGNGFTYAFTGSGMTPLLTADDGTTLGFTADIGRGHVLFAGLASSALSDSSSGASLVRALTQSALDAAGEAYVTSPVYLAERGDYVALYALADDYTLRGTYLDIFSPDLTLVTDPVIRKGEAGLYRRVSIDSNIPTVAFGGGFLSFVSETREETSLTLFAAENACASVRLLAPEGLYPSSVTCDSTDGTEPAFLWDETTSSLLIQLYTKPTSPAHIRVCWQEQPTSLPGTRFACKTISVGSHGEDEIYLVRNSGQANGDHRYTDGNSEIVWKFDVSEYTGLQIAVGLVNNYLLEASSDGTHWTKVVDLADFSLVRAAGTNQGVATLTADRYASDDGILYLRLTNNNPSQGWGGGVRFFCFQYLVSDQ